MNASHVAPARLLLFILLGFCSGLFACDDNETSAVEPDAFLEDPNDAPDAPPAGEPEDAQEDAGADTAGEVEEPAWMAWLEAGPHGHQRETRTVVDTTREVAFGAGEAPSPRTLQVTVWLPEAQTEPGPLVIWAHGMGSDREDSTATARLLASRGFVVAAPDFPRTTRRGGRSPDVMDVVEQPVDVRILLDHLLEAAHDPEDTLHGRIDETRIGAGGISLGAMTVLLASWHEPWRDPRFGAVVALTPPACFLPRPVLPGNGPPTVIVLGDADAIVDYATSETALRDAPHPDAYLLRFHGGTHTAFADRVGNLLDGLDHIDVIGCNAVEGDLPIDALGQLSESLGGLTAEAMATQCLSPCQNDALTLPTMPPSRQVRLTRALVVGMFEATLGRSGLTAAEVEAALVEETDVSPLLP